MSVHQVMIATFGDWLRHRRELSEMRKLDRAEFNRIAADLQVAPDDLDAMVQQGPHAADELPLMLKALGIEEARLARTEPRLLRDMERVCALCCEKARCHRELAAGTAAAHHQEFCLNAPTIGELDPQATS
jgi:hypothetical protein